MAATPIGFVGVGRMGGAMARRLIDAGHAVTVYDPSEAAVAALVAKGATKAASPAAVAAVAETVFASLPSPAVVQEVALGADGVVNGQAVKTFIDLSTTGPRVAAAVAKGLAERQVGMLDAPVSGGVSGAEKGTLAVMVSGPRHRFDALESLLKNFGKLFFVGETPGAGQIVKLANNLLAATALAVSSEAIAMGVKAGLDPKVMIDIINVSSGRNSATQDKFPRAVLPRTFDFGFTTGLSYKDVRLCLEEAEALGVPMVVGSATRQMLAITNALFGPDSDFTCIAKSVEQWAGVEIKG
ncbi:MAG TPA: NAD(P)-dependent oxidoreductase [Hyphomicrobiales bacterium]|nr:NAD(P)-dependent oxidoreductase [Hyphomicrobiales bacterium]